MALQHSRLGVDLQRFALNWNLTEPEIALLPTGEHHVVHAPGGRQIFSRTTWSALQNMACKALADEHAHTPDMVGVGRERLCRLAFTGLARAAYDELIAGLLGTGQIAQTGAWLHTPEHRVQLTAGDLGLWQKVEPLLEQDAFHPPRVRDLGQVLHTDENTMRQLLIRVARIGEVYPVAHDHYFTHRAVKRLAQIACDAAAEHGSVNAAAFRDRIGTGRKLAIQILEFFDHIGFTRRAGDRHLLRQPDLFSAQSRAAEPRC
jgi:selenocysteine-specific elongation factor